MLRKYDMSKRVNMIVNSQANWIALDKIKRAYENKRIKKG